MPASLLTRRIAEEAARLLARNEAATLDAARRKAGSRLGATRPAQLPDDAAIRAALDRYRTLFGVPSEAPGPRLQLAADAMAFMRGMQPELAEALDGTNVDASAPLRILLYADDPDAALHRLLDAGRRHRIRRSRLLHGAREAVEVDVLEVDVDGTQVEFWPLRPALRHQPLQDAAHGAPLPRHRLREVTLAAEGDSQAAGDEP